MKVVAILVLLAGGLSVLCYLVWRINPK